MVLGKGRRDLTEQAREAVIALPGSHSNSLLFADNEVLDLEEDALHPIFSRFPETSRTALTQEMRRLGMVVPEMADDPVTGPAALFLKEAIDNVRLHAVNHITDRSLIPGSTCVSLRLLDFSAVQQAITSEGQVAIWAQGITELLSRRGAPSGLLLEVTVADSGDGVPATMRASLEVYDKPHVFEVQAIDQALKPKGTRPGDRPHIAPPTQKGFGFSQMLSALTDLRGLVRIRTGRSQLTWSALTLEGNSLDSRLPTRSLHAWETDELGLDRGTSVSFTFLLNSRQLLQANTLFDNQPSDAQ